MGRKALDLSGKKIGRLTVVERRGNILKADGTKGPALWFCHCECGNTSTYRAADLNRGVVVSCGCYNNEKRIKHGMHKTKIYRIWAGIRARCNNPNDTAYKYYGGRGVEVCQEWSDFESFRRDMGDMPTNNHTIDRIDVNGNYEPSNCKWATRSEQMQNRRPYVNWNQKLAEEDVAYIRRSNRSPGDLARMFGISYSHMCSVINGDNFKHL